MQIYAISRLYKLYPYHMCGTFQRPSVSNLVPLPLFAEELCQNTLSEDTGWWLWFFQDTFSNPQFFHDFVLFFKFHDFSISQKYFSIFKVFHDFPWCWEPCKVFFFVFQTTGIKNLSLASVSSFIFIYLTGPCFKNDSGYIGKLDI